MFEYAGIIINSTSIALDRIFTYKIPDKFMEKICLGQRVFVPFGLGNNKIEGYVIEFYDSVDEKIKCKEIKELCLQYAPMRVIDLELIKFMKKKYLSTYMEGIRAVLPSGVFKNIKCKTEQVIAVGEPLVKRYNKEPYITIVDFVSKNSSMFNKTRLFEELGGFQSSINSLIKNNYLTVSDKIIKRVDTRKFDTYDEKKLNTDQRVVYDAINSADKKIFLLHGITGSGKTEIYLQLAKKQIKKGADVIILVPEIALTPQMVERFKGRLGENVAVFHSRLSEGERFDEWLRVKNKEVKVAIGARSAIFLPFENLGMIIIDEEHENSYKSENDPKYVTKEIGEFLCDALNCKMVLGSATPSIESYYNTINGKYQLLTLNERADGANLPTVKVVDMREELKNNNRTMFSVELYNSIKESLERKEQVILFLNRRGFASFVSCRKCGYVFKCKNCDIALTYHQWENSLHCHYCGYKENTSSTCPKCKSTYVKHFGVGTEKVEQETKKYFPSSNTIRMDFDTTRSKNSYDRIYQSFKNGEADILIGTQMVAKGLDFENVTLVGVIAADLSLNLPDFRASERTFQLITQVSGRAGRGKKQGKVIVQTYNPDHYATQFAAKNDYSGFYDEETKYREIMSYPPYTNLFLINLISKNEDLLIKSTQNIGIILKNKISNYKNVEMLGPCPCAISKIKESFRWQIIFKGVFNEEFTKEILVTVYSYTKDKNSDIKVSFDVNPNSLL